MMSDVMIALGAGHVDMSIEGMRSQRFSVMIFIFLMIGIGVFSGIIYALMKGRYAPEKMRVGEMLMFIAIILGVVVAVIFGATQMLSGYLF
ncbi:MAG: hypothetical protein G3H99_03030 [Ferrovum sp.]|nr:hypothetical protein [Ferrovum sp.]NDU86893.1 hypothetical protein [Ferrovum sp.]